MEKVQQTNEELKTVIDKTLEFGDILLISNKGMGKTNSLMVLSKMFMENARVFIFEDFPKFAVEFDSGVHYIKVLDSDVVETKDTIDLSDYYLSHSKDFTVQRGSFFNQALEDNKNLIFTMEIKDIERKAFFIYSIVQYFYRKAYLRAYKGYNKHEKIIFVIEESQNCFAQATLNRKVFNRLHSIFNVARNLGLHFVLASQRFTDLNPKIRNRTQLLIGKINIDDYELRIHRLLRHSQHREKVLELGKGEFLFTTTDKIVHFPKYESTSKPQEYKPKPKPQEPIKKKGFWHKLLTLDFGYYAQPKPFGTTEPEQETTEQEFQKEDSEDLLDEDWLNIEDE